MSLIFDSTFQNNLYIYRHLSIDKQVIEKPWNGFMQFVETDEWDRLHEQYGVSPYCCEGAVVYLSLIWKLLESKTIFIIPIFDIHTVTKRLNKDYHFVKWQYSCTAEDNKFEDNGFIPARSSYMISPIRDEFQYKHREHGTITEINTIEELISIHNTMIFSNAYSEMNIFGLSKDIDIEEIRRFLSSSERPSLSTLLNKDDIFMDLILGVDIGFHDGMLIASKVTLDTRMKQILSSLNNIIEQYESRSAEIKNLIQFEEELVLLRNI